MLAFLVLPIFILQSVGASIHPFEALSGILEKHLIPAIRSFPYVPDETETWRAMSEFVYIVQEHGTDRGEELLMAFEVSSDKFLEFQRTLQYVASSMSLLPFSRNTTLFERLAPFLHFGDFIRSVEDEISLGEGWDVLFSFPAIFVTSLSIGPPDSISRLNIDLSVREVACVGLSEETAQAASEYFLFRSTTTVHQQPIAAHIELVDKLMRCLKGIGQGVVDSEEINQDITRHICKDHMHHVVDLILHSFPPNTLIAMRAVATLARLCRKNEADADFRETRSAIESGLSAFGKVGEDAIDAHRAVLSIRIPRDKDMMIQFIWKPVFIDGYPSAFRRELVVSYEDAAHVGYVGPRKQWLSDLVDHVFGNIDSSLAIEYSDESKRFIKLKRLDSLANLSDELQRRHIRAVGRLIGLCIRYQVPMGVGFGPSFLKLLLMYGPADENGIDVDTIMQAEDPAFLQGLNRVRELDWSNPPASSDLYSFEGLLPDGENVKVTKDRLEEYIRVMKWKKAITDQSLAMMLLRDGISDALGTGTIYMLTETELANVILVNERPITAQEILRGMSFVNFSFELHSWFVKVLSEKMDQNDVRKLLAFVTGIPKLPLDAAKGPWMRVVLCPSLDPTSLPVSHTCHNELQFPAYVSFEILTDKLLTAIRESHSSVEGYVGYQR
jgi:hypothetical protein